MARKRNYSEEVATILTANKNSDDVRLESSFESDV